MRRAVIGGLAALAALSIGAVGCTDKGSDGAPTTSAAVVTTAPTTSSTTSTTLPNDADAVRVAIVSDSEVTPQIVRLLDESPKIEVVSEVTEPGWRIEELDDALDQALAQEPDVIVYSAGANDLEPLGPQGMIEALHPRIDRIQAASCAVYPVPSVSTADMEPADAQRTEEILQGFEDVLDEWGVTVVSYPSIAAELEDQGTNFYAQGDLGTFHPGEAAFAPIAEALQAAATTCGR